MFTQDYPLLWIAIVTVLAVAVYVDARKRRSRVPLIWGIGTWFLSLLVVPAWYAGRPLRAGEYRVGGWRHNATKAAGVLWFLGFTTSGILTSMEAIAEGLGAQEAAKMGIISWVSAVTIGFWFLALSWWSNQKEVIEEGSATEKKSWGNAAGASSTAPSRATEHQTVIHRQLRERLAEAQRSFDYQFRVRQETQKRFLVGQAVLAPSRLLTRSDDWYSCLAVYATTLLAVTEARLQLSSTVLDRYRAEVIERMVSAERNATQGAHQESCMAATVDVEEVAKAVEASCARTGSYVLEPITLWFATRLSAARDPRVEKPIAGLLAIEATACRDELVPAMMKEFDG